MNKYIFRYIVTGLVVCVVFIGTVTLVAILVTTPAFATVTTPAKVTNLHTVTINKQRVTLQWKKQPNIQRYQVRVMNEAGELIKKRKTTQKNQHKKLIKGLQPNTTYIFQVRAQRKQRYGKYSKRLTVTTKSQPVLYGFWGLNGYISEAGLADVANRFNASIFQVASSAPNYTVTTLLPLVQASGMKVTLRMTEDHSAYTTDGNFDLELWKAQLTDWENSGVQTYIDNGTLVGHMLLDDIDTFSGTDPTAADLDEMARYSKELMPGLMTFVRQKCGNVPEGNYQYVDACVNQYRNYQGYSDGPVSDYIVEQTAAAEERGLDMINGLNIADGGDGSSGQVGWSAGKYAMSAEEITTYGTALLNVPDLEMFLLWEYDAEELWSDGVTIGSEYFDQPELQAALAELGQQAQ